MATPDPGDGIDSLRQAAVSDCHALLAAETELTAQLQHHAKVTEAMMRTMEHGDSLVDTLRSNDSAQIRPALSNSVRAFERARHRARVRLIAVAMAEGATDQDIRELWNISREIVTRAKRELAALRASGGPTAHT
jgi:CRP-like cAMP-binding protein